MAGVSRLCGAAKKYLEEGNSNRSGFAKGIITKHYKYIAIRYNQDSLNRGFVPPQNGEIKKHLAKGPLTFCGRRIHLDSHVITSAVLSTPTS